MEQQPAVQPLDEARLAPPGSIPLGGVETLEDREDDKELPPPSPSTPPPPLGAPSSSRSTASPVTVTRDAATGQSRPSSRPPRTCGTSRSARAPTDSSTARSPPAAEPCPRCVRARRRRIAGTWSPSSARCSARGASASSRRPPERHHDALSAKTRSGTGPARSRGRLPRGRRRCGRVRDRPPRGRVAADVRVADCELAVLRGDRGRRPGVRGVLPDRRRQLGAAARLAGRGPGELRAGRAGRAGGHPGGRQIGPLAPPGEQRERLVAPLAPRSARDRARLHSLRGRPPAAQIAARRDQASQAAPWP